MNENEPKGELTVKREQNEKKCLNKRYCNFHKSKVTTQFKISFCFHPSFLLLLFLILNFERFDVLCCVTDVCILYVYLCFSICTDTWSVRCLALPWTRMFPFVSFHNTFPNYSQHAASFSKYLVLKAIAVPSIVSLDAIVVLASVHFNLNQAQTYP